MIGLSAAARCMCACGVALVTFSQRMVEEILVSMLGHWSSRPRNRAIRLLNMLYDGSEWQVRTRVGSRE